MHTTWFQFRVCKTIINHLNSIHLVLKSTLFWSLCQCSFLFFFFFLGNQAPFKTFFVVVGVRLSQTWSHLLSCKHPGGSPLHHTDHIDKVQQELISQWSVLQLCLFLFVCLTACPSQPVCTCRAVSDAQPIPDWVRCMWVKSKRSNE